LKIYLLPIDPLLQPASQPFRYPPHNEDYGVEQDILHWLERHPEYRSENPDTADWHLLPVFWTRWHLNHDYGKAGGEELAEMVSASILDDSRTFTVCQFDDGPLAPLGASTIMLASRRGPDGIDIPLLSSPHRRPWLPVRHRYLASFVGRVGTHPIREELAAALADRRNVRIIDSEKGLRRFVRTTCASKIALAPRGYGGSSFRFYEAAQLGVVPMLIGDVDTRPFKRSIPWDEISFFTPDAAGAIDLLDRADPIALARMGHEAAQVWREDLAYGRWPRHAIEELKARADQRDAS
jgi:hypothetical protein